MYIQEFSTSDDGEVVGVKNGGLLTTIYFRGGRLERKRARADQKQVQQKKTQNSNNNRALVLNPFQAHFLYSQSHGCMTTVFAIVMCLSRAARAHWWASCCGLPVSAA